MPFDTSINHANYYKKDKEEEVKEEPKPIVEKPKIVKVLKKKQIFKKKKSRGK
jgi:hypothetical protein